MVRRKSGAYFVDAQLVPRVQSYSDAQITENGLSHTSREAHEMVLRNADHVVDFLTRTYPRDYARKNKQVMSRSVGKAITVVCRNAGVVRMNGSDVSISVTGDGSDTENARDFSSTDINTEGEGDMEEEEADADEQMAAMEADAAFAASECGVQGLGEDKEIGIVDGRSTGMNLQAQSEMDSERDENENENTSDRDGSASASGEKKHKVRGAVSTDRDTRDSHSHPNSPHSGVKRHGPNSTSGKRGRRLMGRPSGDGGGTKRARVGGSGGSRANSSMDTLGGKASLRPSARYSDIAGIESILQDVRELIEYPLSHPEIYKHLGIEPPRGILLHGLPGTGKTLLANAIAGELGCSFLKISAPEVVSGMSGESEAKIRELFDQAKEMAPAIVFIDEIDAIAPKRENAQREMERRIVAQLLTSMDDVCTENTNNNAPVIVIGATNRPDSLDPALRRAGRFDREICLGAPDKHARARILAVLCSKLRLEGEIDLEKLGAMTAGFVGADLAGVTREAAVLAVHRIFSELYQIDKAKAVNVIAERKNAITTGTSASDSVDAIVKSSGGSIVGKSASDKQLDESMALVKAAAVVSDTGDVGKLEGKEGASEPGSTLSEGSSGQWNSFKTTSITLDTTVSTDTALAVLSTETTLIGTQDGTEESSTIPGAALVTQTSPSTSTTALSSALPRSTSANRMLEERTAVSDQLRSKLRPLTEKELEPLAVTMADFELAVKQVQPSAKREGFATVPDVTWADVGALDDVRLELRMAIMEPIKNPEKFEAVGLTTPAGVLLYGPPGCGKTLLAKAIASESGTSFISVKGPELLNKYVGESERSIRLVFQRARDSSPCVVFFDELDALCPRRGTESHASERVVNTLLTEMDGLEARKSVFVIAATNRPDMIDPAMLRPGRLDKLLFVDLPSASDRVGILKTVTRKTPLGSDVQVADIAHDKRCEGFSGADLSSLVREATVSSLRESILYGKAHTPVVSMSHFDQAFANTYPSVTEKDRRTYSSMQRKLRSARGKISSKVEEIKDGAAASASAGENPPM
ncbi:hypothetical protein SARC_02409 [Sphaeroforma arctica JP610]|uniref:AAA+ ATPase domain-containing protein n=1 Tax=Sphaeroforma arctica JP610 TaxID=667725 RepID=A0A0L0G8S9_9EUKA|nr:hypothetical protein SARC_02409 [Sphaeroforma arctica JP610]KNC85410.1 hypothetical protein SARC_02409 [Sphaeroforma arctica JP610]|eukprot:XP_014159312.1 hypothetical protein SARC_02409 [Sphaeroforma arctica JP610]